MFSFTWFFSKAEMKIANMIFIFQRQLSHFRNMVVYLHFFFFKSYGWAQLIVGHLDTVPSWYKVRFFRRQGCKLTNISIWFTKICAMVLLNVALIPSD